MKIDDIDFILAAPYLPLRYNAFLKDKHVGFVKIEKSSYFTVKFPDTRGEEIHSGLIHRNGIFTKETVTECLTIAAQKIQSRLELCKNSKDTK